jgi:hypothetical protein
MKILDTPRINKLGTAVAFQSRFGLCLRSLVIPKRTVSAARERVWNAMGYYTRAWSTKLTQPQRERWIVAAGDVLSRSTLNQCGPLTGQQFLIQINLARACVGLPPLWEPPVREHPGLSPATELSCVTSPDGLRLLLKVQGPVTTDVMVFGQAPCSPGRSKRRNVAYLGLLPSPGAGACDITDLYVSRYGPLRPGTRIFIVTRCQKSGWEGPDKVSSDLVPSEAESQQPGIQAQRPQPLAVSPISQMEAQAPADGPLPLTLNMHTGGTRDAQRIGQPPTTDGSEGKAPQMRDQQAEDSAAGGARGGGGPGVG